MLPARASAMADATAIASAPPRATDWSLMIKIREGILAHRKKAVLFLKKKNQKNF